MKNTNLDDNQERSAFNIIMKSINIAIHKNRIPREKNTSFVDVPREYSELTQSQKCLIDSRLYDKGIIVFSEKCKITFDLHVKLTQLPKPKNTDSTARRMCKKLREENTVLKGALDSLTAEKSKWARKLKRAENK